MDGEPWFVAKDVCSILLGLDNVTKIAEAYLKHNNPEDLARLEFEGIRQEFLEGLGEEYQDLETTIPDSATHSLRCKNRPISSLNSSSPIVNGLAEPINGFMEGQWRNVDRVSRKRINWTPAPNTTSNRTNSSPVSAPCLIQQSSSYLNTGSRPRWLPIVPSPSQRNRREPYRPFWLPK